MFLCNWILQMSHFKLKQRHLNYFVWLSCTWLQHIQIIDCRYLYRCFVCFIAHSWVKQYFIQLFKINSNWNNSWRLFRITSGLSSWWSVCPACQQRTSSCQWVLGRGCRPDPAPPAACWERLDPPSAEWTGRSSSAAVYSLWADWWWATVWNHTQN